MKKSSFLLSCFLLVSTVSYFLVHIPIVYAPPSTYLDIFTSSPTSIVIYNELHPTLWFDTSIQTPTDEQIVHLTIQEPGQSPQPFLYTIEEDHYLVLVLHCPITGPISLWGQLWGWSTYAFTEDYLTLSSELSGWTVHVVEPTQQSFMYYKPSSIFENFQPVIEGWEGIYFTNVNQPVHASFIQSLLRAYDDEDGDITSSIVIFSDEYSTNKTTLGEYPLTFSVSDSANNVTYLTIYVRVVDATPPEIIGPNTLISTLSQPLTIAHIKTHFQISDNYDTQLTLQVKSDNFTPNQHNVGTHSVTLESFDQSGNRGEKIIMISVIDDIKPIITGEYLYTRGSQGILTEAIIRSHLQALDNVDGDVSHTLELIYDNYSTITTKAGTYQLHYRAQDQSGNWSNTFVVYVTVNDTIPPVFYVHSSIIHIDASLTLSHQQIIDLLVHTGQIDSQMASSAIFLIDEYEGTQVLGKYNIQVQFEQQNGSKKVISLSIQVVDQPTVIEKPWYKSWEGWVSKWFGLKFVWLAIVRFIQGVFL